MVEHDLAKVGVASSSLVSRSKQTKRRSLSGVFVSVIFICIEKPAGDAVRAFVCLSLDGRLVRAALGGHSQQLFFLVPVERFVVFQGVEATFFEGLIHFDFVIRHKMQAVATEEPQQIAWH